MSFIHCVCCMRMTVLYWSKLHDVKDTDCSRLNFLMENDSIINLEKYYYQENQQPGPSGLERLEEGLVYQTSLRCPASREELKLVAGPRSPTTFLLSTTRIIPTFSIKIGTNRYRINWNITTDLTPWHRDADFSPTLHYLLEKNCNNQHFSNFLVISSGLESI